jgi:hypothetical protein
MAAVCPSETLLTFCPINCHTCRLLQCYSRYVRAIVPYVTRLLRNTHSVFLWYRRGLNHCWGNCKHNLGRPDLSERSVRTDASVSTYEIIGKAKHFAFNSKKVYKKSYSENVRWICKANVIYKTERSTKNIQCIYCIYSNVRVNRNIWSFVSVTRTEYRVLYHS